MVHVTIEKRDKGHSLARVEGSKDGLVILVKIITHLPNNPHKRLLSKYLLNERMNECIDLKFFIIWAFFSEYLTSAI